MRARRGTALVVLAGILLMCGCTSATITVKLPPSSASPTSSSPTSKTPPQKTPTPTCGAADATVALNDAVRRLPPPFADPSRADVTWVVNYSDVRGYDPCAELSWILVTIEGGTVSSPVQVALFHRGRLVGPATTRSFGFWPEVSRVSDREVEVTYRYAREDESNADASGRAVSRFVWNEKSGAVSRTGDLPPMS